MLRTLKVAAFAIAVATSGAAHAESPLKPLGDGVFNFWSDYYNSLVVIGDDGVLVVDPAWGARATAMKEEIAKVTDKPVTHVVLTHEHYDHAGGTEVFEGADIVCHVTCSKFFELDVLGAAPDEVSITFEDKLSIDLGGTSVELTHMGTGDGVATTVVYVPSAEVVATADLYAPSSLTNGMWLDDKNYLGTRKILNEVATWPMKHALSGHAESTDPAALRENAEYLNALYDAVKVELDKAMAEGGPSAAFALLGGELPQSVKLPAYETWDGYSEHLPKHVWRMGMSIMHGG